MNDRTSSAMMTGVQNAFIDASVHSDFNYTPQLIYNNHKEGTKVLSSIIEELRQCDSFDISVAFIKLAGLEPLLLELKELERKGVKGRILTTDYLTFTEPEALDKLASLKNIEVRMYQSEGTNIGFHTKGYIFRKGDVYRIIVGSSNLTDSALSRNKEWNTKLISTEEGSYAHTVLSEFESLWNSEKTKEYDDFIATYREKYRIAKEQQRITSQSVVMDLEQYKLTPNDMQVKFSENLKRLREKGEDRALLISATGTGKTYASAFALRDAKPARVLFVVHREQIAKQAMASYQRVFGNSKTYGLMSGHSREKDKDIVFATMQTMSRDYVLKEFEPDAFDIIVVDEVHRVGASSYDKILSYFKPKFLLGMTASPERTDDFDVFGLFHYNIAHEIRLQQAMEDDLLCPFHYFGIADLEVNGEAIDDTTSFSRLVSDERVKHVIEKAEYYGFSGDRVKGLVFCSRIDEAKELSRKFNERGYRTEALSGADSPERRADTLDRLASDTRLDYLDYVFAVDILNEGIDIVELNQIIMLRPTQSPIIFVQQLGRGLRKAEGKEFVVVLDFIGNYNNNYMIPIALSGDRSYKKDTMRRFVSEGTRILAGSSSIHFDEITRKRIYASIDSAKTNTIKLIKESYTNLKNKLGRIPTIEDFEEHGEIDVAKIFEKCKSYHNFLEKYEDDYRIMFSTTQEKMLQFVSMKLANGKRIHELELLRMIAEEGLYDMSVAEHLKNGLYRKYGVELSLQEAESVAAVLTNRFQSKTIQKKWTECVFITEENPERFVASQQFEVALRDVEFRRQFLDVLHYGIRRYESDYAERYRDSNLALYQKYTYEDVCRLLNWESNINGQNIGGYKYDSRTKTLPVFINYEKEDEAIGYEDRFISPKELIALSKQRRSVKSADAKHIYKRSEEDKDNRIYLFVRKNKDDNEAKEFYFLGEVETIGDPEAVVMEKTKYQAFEIDYSLDHAVREDLYDYIVND